MKERSEQFASKPFDADEQALMQAVEKGEFVASEDTTLFWQHAVKNTLKKKAITVRVQEQDIRRIKSLALQQGIPYQTLVSSILHQYASGALQPTVG